MKINMKMEWNGSIAEIAERVIGGDGTRFFMAETAREFMDPFVPMDTGALAGSAAADSGGVTYGMGYAVYNYYGGGKNFRQDKHPMAGAFWDKTMMAARGGELVKRVEARIKGG